MNIGRSVPVASKAAIVSGALCLVLGVSSCNDSGGESPMTSKTSGPAVETSEPAAGTGEVAGDTTVPADSGDLLPTTADAGASSRPTDGDNLEIGIELEEPQNIDTNDYPTSDYPTSDPTPTDLILPEPTPTLAESTSPDPSPNAWLSPEAGE